MAARQYYAASNAGPVNNTSNSTWGTVVTLPDFEPDASSTYALFWTSALQNASNTSADAQLRVRFGPAGFETTIATLNLESAATTEYPQLAGMFFHVEDVAPVDVYADVAIKAETNGNSINAKNGQIVALKLGANDVAAESLSRQTTTSTTPADAVTANFTSDGGDYVVVGYGEFDTTATTVPVYIRLRCEGTNTGILGARSNDTTNLTPGMMVWRFASVPAGARSAGFQYAAHSGQTAGITNARILVMRAADFDAVYGAQLTSDSTGTQTDATALTFTETLTANPHLLLGGWGTSGTTTSTNITTQVTEAGSDIAESIRRTYNASATRFHNSAFASVRTPGAGSKTYTLDRVQAGPTNITVGAGSGLWLLDLGASGGGNDIAGTAVLAVAPTGAITGRGSLAGTVSFSASPTAALIGRGAVVGSTTFGLTPTGALAGRGILSGSASASLAPTGALSGFGSLTGTAEMSLAPAAALAGFGAVSGASSFSVSPTGALQGLALIAGSVGLSLSSSATLLGIGALSGSSAIVFTLSATAGGSTDSIAGSAALAIDLAGSLAGIGDVSGAISFGIAASGSLAPPSNSVAGSIVFGMSLSGTLSSLAYTQIIDVPVAPSATADTPAVGQGGPIGLVPVPPGHIVNTVPSSGQIV